MDSRTPDAPFCLAQISDPHLTSLAGAPWRTLANKRVLGYLSWRRRRRHVHSPQVLDALRRDPPLADADLIAVTGDLTHVGLPQEYDQAAHWLQTLGDPARVQVIPGNHELYVDLSWTEGLGRWAPYLSGDRGEPVAFPTLRRRGPVAVIGLNSAVATPPFMASGRLGREQLDKLRGLLRQSREAGLCRVILIHHPPVPGTEKWRKRLVDAPELAAVVADEGAELVLHGHSHRWTETALHRGSERVPVIGIPSASALSDDPHRAGAYALFRVWRDPDHWCFEEIRRRYDRAGDTFIAAGERRWRLFAADPARRG